MKLSSAKSTESKSNSALIDVVVNNAGIQYRAPFVEFPAEKFDAIMRSNVYAPFFVAQAAAKA